MTGETRNDPKLTTAEIVNPATPRSQYQSKNPNTTTEVVDRSRDVDVNRSDVNRGDVNRGSMNREMEMRREAAATQTRSDMATKTAAGNEVQGTRDILPDQRIQSDRPGELFPDNELNEFRARWDKVQIRFVDEPRAAVEQADGLVASVVKRIAEQFAAERAELENQWDRGDNVSTEDLRQALRRYRSFFDRLLAF